MSSMVSTVLSLIEDVFFAEFLQDDIEVISRFEYVYFELGEVMADIQKFQRHFMVLYRESDRASIERKHCDTVDSLKNVLEEIRDIYRQKEFFK